MSQKSARARSDNSASATASRACARKRHAIEAQLAEIKKAPRLVRSFFMAPTVAYITDR
jgi:hypothetical protein